MGIPSCSESQALAKCETFEAPSFWDLKPGDGWLPDDVHGDVAEVVISTPSLGDCEYAEQWLSLEGESLKDIGSRFAGSIVGLSDIFPSVRRVKLRVEVPRVFHIRYTLAPPEVRAALKAECSRLGARIEKEVVEDERRAESIVGYDDAVVAGWVEAGGIAMRLFV